MYTVDDKKDYNDFDDEEEIVEGNFWQRNKGIIIKLLIIVICVIILVLLIKALKKTNNVVYDENIHNNNVSDVRLAAEEYFFAKNNLPSDNTTREVTLSRLLGEGLVKEVVDANKKACDGSKSLATLTKDDSLYILKIKLNCSTSEKEEIFYYSVLNGTCLNCNGKTIMNGQKAMEKEDKNDEKTIDYSKYSCSTWSSWSGEKINDSMLLERTRTLVKGVKKGELKEKVEYGEWSNWQKDAITQSANLEIETKTVDEQIWGSEKTTTKAPTASDKLRVLSSQKVSGKTTSYCPSGYKKSGSKCVSNKLYKGDLTYKQYNSDSYKVLNKPCEALNTEKNKDGNYVWVYKSCQYRKVTAMKKGTSSGYTVYTYQELETLPVTYYRYRLKTITNVFESDQYTIDYYEEKNLPKGYQKLSGSEKIEYSYKMSVCEK